MHFASFSHLPNFYFQPSVKPENGLIQFNWRKHNQQLQGKVTTVHRKAALPFQEKRTSPRYRRDTSSKMHLDIARASSEEAKPSKVSHRQITSHTKSINPDP